MFSILEYGRFLNLIKIIYQLTLDVKIHKNKQARIFERTAFLETTEDSTFAFGFPDWWM